MINRNNAFLQKVLKADIHITKAIVKYVMSHSTLKSLAIHGKALEISCHGIAWLCCWIAFIWIWSNQQLYQMQLNMLLGLIFDIIVIALLKSAVRRRRPAETTDMLTIGPDKFSFPSGHASRAFYVITFFILLHPLSVFTWPPLISWAVSVAISRIALRRHYLLDVLCGAFIGVLEAGILSILWINRDTAINFINYISNDNLPGGEADVN